MKILVIRFSSIGDIVLTTPLLRCIKQQLPGSEIHFLTRHAFTPLLETNPYVGKVIPFSATTSELSASLKLENYDFVLDLQKNFRSRVLRLRLGLPSASFPKLNIRKWVLVHLKRNYLPDLHIVDRYFVSLKKLNVYYDGSGLDFFFAPGDEEAMRLLPNEFKNGYITLTCGSKHFTKQMPEALIVALIKNSPFPVVLLGGKEDEVLALRVVEQCGEKALNACGKLSIRQSAYLVHQSLAIIASDTGLMHIAAALKKRIISVWGNTVPAFGMYPLMPKGMEQHASIVEVDINCRPCSKLGFNKCPKKHFNCMNFHNPEQIIELLDK
jgi:ADP-heptose:LPS heptosyltransferase